MKVLLLCLPVLLFTSCKSDQKKSKEETVYKQTIFDKLSKDDLLEFELIADFDSLILYKEEEKYYPATFSFKDENDSLVIKEINVGTRGKTRKNICDLPPLRFKFSKPLLKASNLAKYKTLKLVTPCNDKPGFEDLIMKELLCYQMYQELTDQSFRVQPAKLKIKQKESDTSRSIEIAFLIEHEKEMAKRLGGKLLDKSVEKIKSIDVKSYNLLVLFQYMIGNTDWNLSMRHNIKLVQMEGNSAPIPVPYDFDYSGLVNAQYAIPHPSLPIKNIRERLFQWKGKDTEMLKEPIAQLLEKKEVLLSLMENCQLENKEEKTLMINYVKSFFEIIESEGGMDVLTKKL
jgi:hypothetical protein